jgi:hypothetical protein
MAETAAGGDPEPGYYASDIRRLRVRELARITGLASLPLALVSRYLAAPTGRTWLPQHLPDHMCRPEELSSHFHSLTDRHRAVLAKLDFETCFAARPVMDPSVLDQGMLVSIDPSRSRLATLSYVKRRGSDRTRELLVATFQVSLGAEALT